MQNAENAENERLDRWTREKVCQSNCRATPFVPAAQAVLKPLGRFRRFRRWLAQRIAKLQRPLQVSDKDAEEAEKKDTTDTTEARTACCWPGETPN